MKELHRALLRWYEAHKRDLPWRKNRDPYRVWISEIMLQQTRVETVIPYYERFLSHFPTVDDLARAAPDTLLNLWAGLGYYSRARNLQAAARQIQEIGRFPDDIEDLRTLKGIGAYTAAAIASIAFGRGHAAIDGNLERVISRLLASRKNPKKEGREEIARFGAELVAYGSAGEINQAFMDLSSRICLPKQPRCEECPVQKFCKAFAEGIQRDIPVKEKKARPKELRARGWILIAEGELLLARRPKGQWLQGMWDIPWWLEGQANPAAPPHSASLGSSEQKRTITSHKIAFTVDGIQCDKKPAALELPADEFRWVKMDNLHGVNLPRPSERALEEIFKRLDN
jgi:A/G-specific adenine glycosylase